MTDPQRRVRGARADDYYDDYWSGTTSWRPTDPLDDELRGWLSRTVRPGLRVLDVGCGDGSRYGEDLARAGVRLHGVDVSGIAVAEARRRGLDASRAALDEPLPFADGAFDAAICLEVLEHLVDPEFAAREIRRVLHPGGALLVSVPNTAHWRTRLELMLVGRFDPKGSPATARRFPWRDPHLRFFTARSLADMLGDAGFDVVDQGGLDTQFLNAAPLLRRLVRPRRMAWLDGLLRGLARRRPTLLAGRCVAIAVATPAGAGGGHAGLKGPDAAS